MKNKSKEEIAKEMKIKSETERLRKFSKDIFYPFLKKNTESVSDARQFLQIIDVAVKAEFNEGLRTTTVGDLNMNSKIRKTAPDSKSKRYSDVFSMFENENLTSFTRIVGDFQQVIGTLMQEWEDKEKLDKLSSPYPSEK